MKISINTNSLLKKSIKLLLNDLNALLIKNKQSTFSFNYSYYNSLEKIKKFHYIFVIIDDDKDINKYNELINLQNKYLLNYLVVFYNKNIDISKYNIDYTFSLVQSYNNLDELYYYLFLFLLILKDSKNYTRSKIDKIIKNEKFNINIKNISFIRDINYKNKYYKLYKKFIKCFLTFEDYSVEEICIKKDKKSNIIDVRNGIIDFALKIEELFNDNNLSKDDLNNKIDKLIFDTKKLLLNDKKIMYSYMSYIYYYLAQDAKKNNNDENFNNYIEIGLAYVECLKKFDIDMKLYYSIFLEFVSLKLNYKIDYNILIEDLNRMDFNEQESIDIFTLYANSIVVFTLYSYCYYRIGEENISSYYLNKTEILLEKEDALNTFEALYEASCFARTPLNTLSISLLELYIKSFNIDSSSLNINHVILSLILLIKNNLFKKNIDKCYEYIDEINKIYDRSKDDYDVQDLLISIELSLLTGKVLYYSNAPKEDIEFHINMTLDYLNKINFDSDDAFYYFVIVDDMEYILDYYRSNNNIEKYNIFFSFIKKITNTMQNIESKFEDEDETSSTCIN